MKKFVALLLPLALLSACRTDYRWTSRVPDELRTVAVPVFENRTQSAELGPICTQYALREFQREGTFKIRRHGESALEVQGAIVEATRSGAAFDRNDGVSAREYRYRVKAEITLLDRKNERVLVDRRVYFAETTFGAKDDVLTGQRNAAQRVAQDLARQIVDDVCSHPYNKAEPAPAPRQ